MNNFKLSIFKSHDSPSTLSVPRTDPLPSYPANYLLPHQIQSRLSDHLSSVQSQIPSTKNFLGIFLQGSQNYGLDIPSSDIDDKLILIPSVKDIIFNSPAVSTTRVHPNSEHTDLKDIRLYFQLFKKQNINFVEILFTEYKILNPLYSAQFNILVSNKESVAHYAPLISVKTMAGMAKEKFYAMEHPYPNKAEILAKYHYDPKQLHHLVRMYYFMTDYINDVPYAQCLTPKDTVYQFLMDIKTGCFNLEKAREIAKDYMQKIDDLWAECNKEGGEFYEKLNKVDKDTGELIDSVQYEIMNKYLKRVYRGK